MNYDVGQLTEASSAVCRQQRPQWNLVFEQSVTMQAHLSLSEKLDNFSRHGSGLFCAKVIEQRPLTSW